MKNVRSIQSNPTQGLFLSQCKKIALASLVALSLSSCVTALIAGAAIATVDIIHDRRTAGEYLDDNTIELTARNFLLSSAELRSAAHVKPTSWNGILLLTGEIDSEAVKEQVINKFRNIEGVRQLVDETTITGKTALIARSNDAWITTKVNTRLVAKTGMDANRVKVITTRGSVYMMGIVTEYEANRATEAARTVRGVARVVKVFEYKTDI